jgi:S1-C subfamily serine protease
MPAPIDPPIVSNGVEPDESPDEDRPLFSYLPPDDRLWRHPSEVQSHPTGPTPVTTAALLRPGTARTWTVAILAGMVGALVASGVGVMAGGFDSHTTTVVAPITRVLTPNTLSAAPLPGWPSIVDAVSYSVASVSVMTPAGVQVGSGVVYTVVGKRTYLLTDAALVEQGGPINVTFNGSNASRAYLIRTDNKTGLAMLWVGGTDHSAPQMGTIGYVRQAEQVMAIGARATNMASTVPGSVSSLDRTVVDATSSVAQAGLLALTASVPAADAGGAVVDAQGALVGIATSVHSTDPADSGLSFAVPVDIVQHVAAQMLSSKTVTHPWLGVLESSDLDSATAQRMGVGGGAQLTGVAANSPLATASVQSQDVVVSLNGQAVTSSGSLTALLDRCAPGDVATLGYRHGGSSASASVRVAEQPSDIDAP